MSDIPGTNTVPLHKARAGEHLSLAEGMVTTSPEWSRVASFYSAYHCVKTALLEDPVFGNLSTLAAANPNLTLSSQTVTHHQGNLKRGREFGINEIVRHLYFPFYSRYILLHGASLSVRYGDGVSSHSAEDCLTAARYLHEALEDGRLVHVPR